MARSPRVKDQSLWKVSVVTTPEAEDALSVCLSDILQVPATSYHDLETGSVTVTAYLHERAQWSTPVRKALHTSIHMLKASGLDAGTCEVRFSRLARKNWAESWKRHFKPLRLGSKLLVRPSWSKARPLKGQAQVVLDPGLSFGTGRHPTTEFCLRQIARSAPGHQGSLLDLGTGSGILAIAAAKLGYAPIVAIEYDREALEIARANARKNRVLERIEFKQQDVSRLPRLPSRRYSLVCANLISDLLIAERKRIAARVEPGGILVLAGILASEFDAVLGEYAGAGFILKEDRAENEWRSGAFTLPDRKG